MKTWILALAVSAFVWTVAAAAPAPSKPVPSSSLKAYSGPEGQVIVLVEANDSKQMLVHFKNVGNGLDGTTWLYSYEDRGEDNKTVFTIKKQGSKTYRSIMLTSDRPGHWEFTNPVKTSSHFTIKYSAEASKETTVDEVLAAYHP